MGKKMKNIQLIILYNKLKEKNMRKNNKNKMENMAIITIKFD
jgi:hypothetical protein